MNNMGLLGAAVANNASWCDAVCRSHGFPGTFGPRLWRSTQHQLRFYPNAITLRPEVTAPEVVPAVSASQPCGVKDSFARLDLAPAGFRLAVEGNWIVCDDGPDAPPDDGLSWDKVTRPGELSAWETAWGDGGSGDGPVFRPGLLSDPRCAILTSRRDDAIIAGAIIYAAGGAAGISNVFGIGLSPELLWASVRSAAARLRPDLPLVGWEGGADLEAAQHAGFHAVGPLYVWTRPAPAP